MTISPAVMKQAELTRYAKAMRNAGVSEWRLEIAPDGTKSFYVGKQKTSAADQNDWDAK
jgi:hypothetical protein